MSKHTWIPFFAFFALAAAPVPASAQTLDFEKLANLKIRNVGPANMSGRITAIAESLSAEREIDATGKLVLPGGIEALRPYGRAAWLARAEAACAPATSPG